jgi:hypothetical protein
MNLKIEEGISNWLLLTIVLLCASPAITLNVWPRIDAMITNGSSSNQLGIVLLVTLSALGMTCVPFAMKKAENLGFWLTCLVFGIGLGILNYTMAVGAVGKIRDNEADVKKALISKAAQIRSSIRDGEEARKNLPPFKWTTQEMVQTAIRAVDLAIAARDQECTKIGDICRARVSQLGSRQAELAAISAERALTTRAEQLDKSLISIRSDLSSLGAIPEDADQQASRIAVVVGYLFNLGSNASERVATGLIHFLAICAEAFALGMPRIITTALSATGNPRLGGSRNPPIRTEGPSINEEPKPPNPLPPSQSSKQPARVSSSPRSGIPPEPSAPSPISEWKDQNLIRSPNSLRTWDAYVSYKSMASLSGRKPAPFPLFDSELERLGIKKKTEANRDYYIDVAIKTPLKVVS